MNKTSRLLNHLIFSILMVGFISLPGYGQEEYKDPKNKALNELYPGGSFYEVQNYVQPTGKKQPKNIILMIGDGMGLAQVYSAMTANGGHLFLENFKNIGFSKTYSSDNYITDSAAGGTALSAGIKTYNGAIGVDPDKQPVPNIREMAEKKGLKTGLVSTSAITHATPASFIAHASSRNSYEDIAADFLKTNIDVFIGGGIKNFEDRKDGKNLSKELEEKGYQVLYNIDDIQKIKSGKLAGFTAQEHDAPMPDRGEILVPATQTAINLLSQGKKGFFLMVEGSEIDFLAHENKTPGVVLETLDFDRAIGAALKFAASNGETLIIVTADHETGGMTLNGGDYKTGKVIGKFTSGGHTGIAVPVYAFGPGAEQFTGFMENTDIAKKMMKLLNLN
ncbi:MAG TPA: alkaline phosphatase [Prolixibacteraceae bacterium]|nr:alkaline phosphatase [Prolixibacteraceae bacterium]